MATTDKIKLNSSYGLYPNGHKADLAKEQVEEPRVLDEAKMFLSLVLMNLLMEPKH